MPPCRKQRFGALVGTAPGKVEERMFARHRRIAAILAGESGVFGLQTQ